jgi:HK97 family phage portal protein
MLIKQPNMIERLRHGWNVFRRGYPPPRPWALQGGREQKAAPFMWPDWRLGVPQWQLIDYRGYIDEGFNLNTLIYSCIMYKVRAMTAAPLRGYTGDRENPEPLDANHPLVQLLDRPNPSSSWAEFHGASIVYLNIAGNCYVLLDRTGGQGLPEAMYTLRPDRVIIVPLKQGRGWGGYTVGYLYVPEGKNAWMRWSPEQRLKALRRDDSGVLAIPAEDMMHVKLPNPGDELEGLGYGLSPLSPLARSADVDNAVTHFLKLFWDKGVTVPGLLSTDQPLTDTTIGRIKERWKEMYGGYRRWAEELAVLDYGMKYQRLGLTFEEMGFDGLDERNEARVCAPFGVPPLLIGARVGLRYATYSNAEQMRLQFWEDTMVPETRWYEAEYQYYLRTDDAFVAFDFSRVPALMTVAEARRLQALAEWQGGGITLNEYRGRLQLEPDPVGDYYLRPLTLMPVPFGKQPEPPPSPEEKPEKEPAAEAAPPEPESVSQVARDSEEGAAEAESDEREEEGKALPFERKGFTPEAKQRLWQQQDTATEAWEPRFADAGRGAFEQDRRALLAILTAGQRKAYESKATVDWQAIGDEWLSYLQDEAPAVWWGEFGPAVRGLMEQQGRMWAGLLGQEWDAAWLSGEWFDNYRLKFSTQILDTTELDLSALLKQAQREGWSIPQMQKAIGALFERYVSEEPLTDAERAWFEERLPQYRLERIARTESHQSSSLGTFLAYGGLGVKEHEWLTVLDGRERETHRATNGQVRKLGEPFNVGEAQLLFPGDPAGPPEETIQCRCATLPVLPGM